MVAWLDEVAAGTSAGTTRTGAPDILESRRFDLATYVDPEPGEVTSGIEDENLAAIQPGYWEGNGYRDRLRFARQLPDEVLRDQLEEALAGRGAFRRLRAVLDTAPSAAHEAWEDIGDDRHLGRAIKWMPTHDLRIPLGGQGPANPRQEA